MKSKIILLVQISLVLLSIFTWEYLSYKNIINSFIFSSPSKIFKLISVYIKSGNLFFHIFITLIEIMISFSASIIVGFLLSILFYEYKFLYKIIEPFLTILNSTPKIAIGPLIIILFGAGYKSIIIMTLSITLVPNILSIYNGFNYTDLYLSRLMDSLKATKYDRYKYLVIPSAYKAIINSLKLNISMTLIGVIMGEFLTSKAGIGYLIIYGTQVFNLTLVMSGILILCLLSTILFVIISLLEKRLNKKIS